MTLQAMLTAARAAVAEDGELTPRRAFLAAGRGDRGEPTALEFDVLWRFLVAEEPADQEARLAALDRLLEVTVDREEQGPTLPRKGAQPPSRRGQGPA